MANQTTVLEQAKTVTTSAPPRATWRPRDAPHEIVSLLRDALELPEPLARVLAGRGITTAGEARKYLDPSLRDLPDPGRLAGVDAAVARLDDALARGETVGVFGV